MYSSMSPAGDLNKIQEINNSPSVKTNEARVAQIYLDDPLYDREGAAIYITPPQRKRPYSVGTLAVWDCTKRYDLQPIKINGKVYYRQSILDRFIREQLKP
jgi:hypothetical protein